MDSCPSFQQGEYVGFGKFALLSFTLIPSKLYLGLLKKLDCNHFKKEVVILRSQHKFM